MDYEERLKYWNDAIEASAMVAEEWGDQCAGGSGREIVKDGPSKGQMYGQAYYNLANSIRNLHKVERRRTERRRTSSPEPPTGEKR